ncbi:MAG: right-handed parallel beta-helix repeat-containing protein [Caldilineaceae bacterium]|nr:right-handed parallel beta-helix repeat-containing protein [Caldilineaceae bacterium]
MVTIFKRLAIVVVLVCTLGLPNWPSFAQTSDETTGAFNIFVPIVANDMVANNMAADNVVANDTGARELTVLAAGVVTELQPTGYVTEQGSDGGQSATNLHVMDQSGSQNNWDKYVELETTSKNYRGHRFYALPANIDPASITSLQVKANYLGPEKSYQAWTWRIYDWANGTWVTIGNNTGAPSWQWKLFTFNVPGHPANFVNSSTREIKVRLQSNNTNDNMDLDYEAVVVETGSAPTPTNTPTPTDTPFPPTVPPTNTYTPTPTHTPTATPSATPNETTVAVNEFYVAEDGNDNNVGSFESPWGTIQHAANTVLPGSTVYVRGGNYYEKVNVNVSGTEGAYITFQNYGGELAILDGSNLTVASEVEGLFKVENRSYIIIKGFELQGLKTNNEDYTPAGIWVREGSHHIELRNNRIHDIKTLNRADGNAHGIAVYGSSLAQSISEIVIDGNEIHGLQLGNSEALVLNGNVDGFTVTHNLVYGVDNIGIDVIGWEDGIVGQNGVNQFDTRNQARNGVIRGNTVHDVNSYDNPAYFDPDIGNQYSAGGIYVDGGRNVVIEQNVVYDTDYGIELASEHAGRFTSSVTVRNNFIYHNHAVGIGLGGSEEDNGGAENCIITNNTLFQNGTEPVGAISELYIQNHVHNNTIMNNIISAADQHHLIYSEYATMSGNILDYNLYYVQGTNTNERWVWQGDPYSSIGAYQNATGNDGNSLFGNPQFVSTSSPNLHLISSSPAINAGTTGISYGPEDIDGEGRVQGGAVDIGADEFSGASNAAVEPTPGQFQIFLPTIMGD